MLWLLYSILELVVWDYRVREALTSNSIIHLTASALNDVLWIPIAIALTIYIVLLASKLLKHHALKVVFIFVFVCGVIITMTNARFYFQALWLLVVLYLGFWTFEIFSTGRIRISLLCFAVALAGMVYKYNTQLIPRSPRSTTQSLKVLSFNINTQMALDDQRTVLFIREKLPDIVFLQEFNAHEKMYILSKLGDLYPYHLLPERNHGKNDVLILSRLEVVDGKQVRLKTEYSNNYDSANHAVVVYQGQKIHLLNCHLSHPVRFIPKIIGAADSVGIVYNALKRADSHHREEARLLAEYMIGLDGPIVLAGDFNDTPNSYVYHQFAARYQNAFATTGFGLGTTFGEWTLRQYLPPFLHILAFDYLRIDHVFCSNDFVVKKARVAQLDAFDHRPQIVWLELKE